MSFPFCTLCIFVVGAVGGLVNALLTDNGFILPIREKVGGLNIMRPGVLGNCLISGVAAFISWSLYSSAALKREARSVGTLVFRVPVALLYLLAASSIALAQGRDTRALSSANALFREFEDDPVSATDRYVGKALTLEGARGAVILLSDGTSAAVHISDRGKPNALILSFPDRNELAGVKKGQTFRFTCTVTNFEYGNVWLDDCAVANSAGAEAPRVLSPTPCIGLSRRMKPLPPFDTWAKLLPWKDCGGT